jgi:ABC-type methionine transport system ATPase subunit
MAKKYVTFTYPRELIKEPIIHNLGLQFNIVTNILRADISPDRGWVALELEGDESDIEQGISWVTSKGVRVNPAGEEVREG